MLGIVYSSLSVFYAIAYEELLGFLSHNWLIQKYSLGRLN